MTGAAPSGAGRPPGEAEGAAVSVDRDEVERIAELAKLHLEDDEVDRLTEEMNRILEHAARLRGLAADATDANADTAPTRTSGTGPNRTGGTGPVGVEEPDELLRPPGSFAPDMREGFFVVPPPPGVMHEAGEATGPEGAGAEATGPDEDEDGDEGGRASGDGVPGGAFGGGDGGGRR